MAKMTIEEKRNFILTGNIWKVILVLAIPIALTSTITSLFSLFDAFFTAKIGELELSAVSIVGPLNQVVSAIGMGVTVAGTALIARQIAKRNYEKARDHIGQLVIIAMTISIIVTFAGFVFTDNILRAAGAPSEVFGYAQTYFKISILIVPVTYFTLIHKAVRSASGASSVIIKLGIVQVVLKLLFNFLFISKLEMGVEGLGYATLASQSVVFMYSFYILFFKKSEIKVRFKNLNFKFPIMISIIIVSLPIIVEKSTTSFGHVFMTKFTIEYGREVQTAYSMINRINTTAFTTISGIGSGIVAIVSQNMAVGNISRVKETFKKAMFLAVITATCLLLLIYGLQDVLGGVLSAGNGDIKQHITNGVFVYSATVIPWAVFQVTAGLYNGLGKTLYPMVVSMLRLWIFRLLLIWILIYVIKMNEYSIWFGMLISNILAMLVALALLHFVNINEEKIKTNPLKN